jgi:hypothetical protein
MRVNWPHASSSRPRGRWRKPLACAAGPPLLVGFFRAARCVRRLDGHHRRRRAGRGTRHPAAALAAYGLLAAVVAASTRPAAAAGVALIAWMFDNGFIVGRHADLTWHGAADARRLAILLAAAAAGAMLGSHIRKASQRLNPVRGQAIAVGADLGIPDGHPVPPPTLRPPPHPVTTAAINEQNDGGVPITLSRPAA